MNLKVIALTLLLFTGLLAGSQTTNNNKEYREAYNLIMALRFDDAKTLIDNQKQTNSDNILFDYLNNQIFFLEITLSENEELFNSLKDSIEIISDKITDLTDSNPYKKYLLGNINLQLAINNLRFKNYTNGLWQINKAYRLLIQNQEEHPDFFPNQITLGVLHIMIGIVPDSYSWILSVISMDGTVQQGREELKESLIKSELDPGYNHLTNEILFYITMIDLSLSADPEYAKFVVSKTKPLAYNNLLMSYLTTNIYMKNGENDSALEVLNNIDTSFNYYPFYYLEYLKGDCHLRMLDTKKAIGHYERFLKESKGSNYLKDAMLKISWAYLIEDDTINSKNYLEKVTQVGETDVDADKVAQQISLENKPQNRELLISRLLFDGGYYLKADSVLTNINIEKLNNIEKVELLYRKARVLELLDEYESAESYLLKTIETGKNMSEYYAGNSALKLGNLYEKQYDTINAIKYYNLCINLDFNQYENSIKGKAKQGLNRLSSK